MACMCGRRSSAKNMCSVRHRPMPSAPNFRATLASRGISALARTPNLPRNSSAQSMKVARTPEVGSASSVLALPSVDFARRTVQRNPVAFLQGHLLAVDRDVISLRAHYLDGARARDAGLTHAARDHRRVAGHAAARSQNSLGHFHAVNVVGNGFGADQNHGPSSATAAQPRRR